MLTSFICKVWIIALAFSEGPEWGMSMFIPFVNIVFLVRYWEKTRVPLALLGVIAAAPDQAETSSALRSIVRRIEATLDGVQDRDGLRGFFTPFSFSRRAIVRAPDPAARNPWIRSSTRCSAL